MEHRGSALRGQACTFLSSRLVPGSLGARVSNQEISPFSRAVLSVESSRWKTSDLFRVFGRIGYYNGNERL